jgi:hypothetical protein
MLSSSAIREVRALTRRALGTARLSRRGWSKSYQHCELTRLARLRGRGRLLALLEAPTLISKLDVAHDGRLVPREIDWATFWAPLHRLSSPMIGDALSALHAAWQEYIRSRFNRSLQREYCFRYFRLLDLVLSAHKKEHSSSWKRALRTLVGFECFGLRAPGLGSGVLAAGATTLRNPCYLLAKLKWPAALDDTQFLPILAVGDNGSASLFYHYRQYRLSKDSQMSLLLHLPASPTNRSASFNLLDSLAGSIGSGLAPRTAQRARRLAEGIIKPVIRAAHPDLSGPLALEVVDVGAGTGGLTAALCRRLLAWSAMEGFALRFLLWFADLCLADPVRFFRTSSIRRSVDSLMFLGTDYRTWLARPRPLPKSLGLRVALVSKLFNNLSRFSVCSWRTNVLPSRVVGSGGMKGGTHMPSRCLAPDGAGPEALLVSNSRVTLEQGRTFAQASLSDYYRALHLISGGQGEMEIAKGEVCLPLRALDPECLVTSDGASVLARMLQHCDYLIVEDADLRPKELVEHLNAFALHGLTACDMTRAQGLTGNYAYVLWGRDGKEPRLGGERLW